MNSSDLKKQIYAYLGFHGVGQSDETDRQIESCLSELELIGQFNYLYRFFECVPDFLQKSPYIEFLEGCNGVILSVMTLGAETDRKIKLLSRTNMALGVVMDACASAYLEYRSDEFEKSIGDNLTYRFCPGYGGSSVSDLRDIFTLLRPERIGVTLNESNFMLPTKSMAGVIGVGKHKEKSCGSCILLGHCKYREDGIRCYGSEKK